MLSFPGGCLGSSYGAICKCTVHDTPGPNFLQPSGTCNMSPGPGAIERRLTVLPFMLRLTSTHVCFKLGKTRAFRWVIFQLLAVGKQRDGAQMVFSFKLVSFGSEVDWGNHQAQKRAGGASLWKKNITGNMKKKKTVFTHAPLGRQYCSPEM